MLDPIIHIGEEDPTNPKNQAPKDMDANEKKRLVFE